MCSNDTKKIVSDSIARCSCKSKKISRFLLPALLLLLSEKPSHGYELAEKYTVFGFTDAGSDPGSVYRTLRLLDSGGFINSKWETEETGPAKKVYSITDEGLKLLSSWIELIKERKKSFELFLERYSKIK
jgi:PadR family transcriptional regulator, regulatory protein PadR